MFYRKLSFILFLIMIISGCAEEKRAVENNIQPAETNNMYYTITFYGNGGTGLMDSLKVKQGESVLLPANKFVNEGRVFAGWSNDYKNSSILYNDLDVLKQAVKSADEIPKISRVVVGEGITNLSNYLLTQSGNYMISLPSTLENIGMYSFLGYSGYTIIIPNLVTTIPISTFSRNSSLFSFILSYDNMYTSNNE